MHRAYERTPWNLVLLDGEEESMFLGDIISITCVLASIEHKNIMH